MSDAGKSGAALAAGVDRDLVFEIEQFLYREARLLDEERYDEWLATMAPDVHYWMPGIQARYRADKADLISRTRMAYFDDDLDYLTKRVERAKQTTAWAEDPPTRHFHMVSNIEVEATEIPDEWVVHSLVLNLRHRNEAEEQTLTARRQDLVRRDETGALKLARRLIRLQQTVLQAKNMNAFL
ncbi:3-phenylpropionate/cinnamic acid dioxygenase subunit beta [Altererythrobacter marinus]|uniref:3-phenylpropionate/cinnamic acid dioxygenase subunit beta n=1 Tax=Pelagerythrobacter marinus TaxID=538382 RepID=A0ABW9V4V5_9SPHN|nr:3-phenylpropionate/cinnamic acid dioxygenase subunit beta [Pelagerythrobacter marinus]MBU0825822.1 3-phenylpropionate/cinnamic acid dioxygenase subunit beta [Alphaproteobacteria bacterium]MBU0863381.1 3-phenylpropionate/cinnamic acid dioxygenase subunit beta [Alphaproteobacteria bacterium]MBU1826584.1 3-phenylpropionate/cinnamic acid dioxygenase subunit beta [Alphaproteobacteria bacterium]MXO69967.1 3-phenylpropionate/cinnamic acid dioxygenase subunit beta [Pelagerythrobacter marinus]